MKFGVLEIPQDVLLSLRNHNLVVFAGAGVSMGSPSDLPNFIQLAEKIDPTRKVKKGMQIDRFLGVSQRKGVKVYQRAKTLLSDPASKPNELHKNLIGLFGDPNDIRIVTTNFDQHFEKACEEKGWKGPDVYSAPALPLGSEFSGIVHIHGDLVYYSNIVLTDSDFGRAYLTEGWARRFLLDLYNHYSILFVGYSYEDTIVHYLTHGLTTDISKKRFAICEERDKDKWITYGIQPIIYKKMRRKNPYSQLYDGVENFSIRVSRSLLEWRDYINSTAVINPPCSIEDDSQFEQIFLELETTRLFLNRLTNVAWLHWLSQKNLIACLFLSNPLSPVQKELAQWISETMLWKHPRDVLLLINSYSSINQEFWEILCRTVSYSKKHMGKSVLFGIVSILINYAPRNSTSLSYLAEYCFDNDSFEAALEIFLHLCKVNITIKQKNDINGDVTKLIMEPVFYIDYYRLFEIWEKLKQCLETIYQPVLHALLFELENFYNNRKTFDPDSPDYDFFFSKDYQLKILHRTFVVRPSMFLLRLFEIPYYGL